ncbi:MAG: hypothetical protein AB7S41_08990 [Parvibaculaceae bacterium]
MNLPSLVIITAAKRVDANRVWDAMGRGPNTFIRRLTDDPSPTSESEVTHYCMFDTSALDSDVADWQAMTNGDLPPIAGTWGADGVIDAADAQAAVAGSQMQVYSAAGDVTPLEYVESVIAGRGLSFVPDEV